MTTVVVGGALADKPGSGGEAWVRMSWVRGLQLLGLDVWFVEDASPAADRDYFRSVVEEFGIADRASLLVDGGLVAGPDPFAVAEDAVLVNISGNVATPDLFRRYRRRVYVDIDPGFTQVWHAQGLPGARVAGHEAHATIAENIARPGCLIPSAGVEWFAVRQPVVLADWPHLPLPDESGFTTVTNWRPPFGPLEWGGRSYGLKVHEFRKVLDLPRALDVPFELALSIHPGDDRDRQALLANGWRLVDPSVAAAPDGFRRYVQGSAAEFSVAQGVYVDMHSGWFSDRTVRYLASGRPALVQETGFSDNLPSGAGLVAFSTTAEAVSGAQHILRNREEHAAAAHDLAARHFAHDVVLPRFCERAGIS
jgi:hypothetical protein